MGIVFDNPEDNTEEKLVSHVTRLAKLDTKELAKLAEKGKDDLKAKDEEVLREINAKHRVK